MAVVSFLSGAYSLWMLSTPSYYHQQLEQAEALVRTKRVGAFLQSSIYIFTFHNEGGSPSSMYLGPPPTRSGAAWIITDRHSLMYL